MKRCAVVIVTILLLLCSGAPRHAEAVLPAAGPAFPSGDIIIFVGNEIVDLMWAPVPGATAYTIYRDGSVLFGPGQPETEPLTGDKFYRDHDVNKGETHQYQVCATVSGSPDCSAVAEVELGLIQGMLYKDHTWGDAFYDLDGTVRLVEGVTLTIEDGAVVSGSAPLSSIETGEGASLGRLIVQVSGGVAPSFEDMILRLYSNDNVIAGEEGNLVQIGQNTDLVLHGDTLLEHCEFKHETQVVVAPTYGVPTFRHNRSGGGSVYVAGTSAEPVEFSNNDFSGCGLGDCIRLRDGASATITDNSFAGVTYNNQAIDVGGSSATITGNRFYLSWSTYGVLVWPNSGGEVVIRGNELYGATDPQGGTAIYLLRPDDVEPPAETGQPARVTVEGGNVIRNVDIGIFARGHVQAEIRNNSITYTDIAVAVTEQDTDVTVNGNCIVANLWGALADDTWLDATGNWWGSRFGPSTGESATRGDRIVVYNDATVVWDPWLDQDNCHRLARNLSVAGMEVTQVTQTLDQQVPLVKGKPGVVRVYPCSDAGEVSGVTGVLTGWRGTEFLGTLHPRRSIVAPYVRGGCDDITPGNLDQMRAAEHQSLLFQLPEAWASGAVSLTVELNPDYTIEERTHDDNTASRLVSFQEQRPLTVGQTSVKTNGSREVQLLSDSRLELGTLFRKLSPSHSVQFTLLPSIDWPYELEGTTGLPNDKHGAMLLNVLGLTQMRMRASGAWAGDAFDLVYGAVPVGAITHWRGDPALAGGRGTAAYGPSQQIDLVTALARNLAGEQPAPPCPATIDEFGYDVAAGRVVPVDALNVWCIREENPVDPALYWIGPEEYQALVAGNALTTNGQQAGAAPSEQTYLFISMLVSDGGQVDFMPTWQVTTSDPPLNPPAGTEYCLELRDGAGAVLESHCFDAPAGYTTWDGFLVALPLTGNPAGVVLRQGTTDLGNIPVTAHPPSVAFASTSSVASASDSILLTWSGDDLDGDTLAYSLLYSPDNRATWIPVATNLEVEEYNLDLSEVPAGDQAWAGVEVSDGFHTAVDEWGPFSVDNHPPTALILHPESGAVVSPTLTLSGLAYDLEDGDLGGPALTWASDLDGVLGTGKRISDAVLSRGTHHLTLTATDSHGRSSSDTVTVFVGEAGDMARVFLPLVRR
ncbi:MAG: right-handed parallel beta-helix repeat-containing protein [Anaerolineae bacterium]